MSNGNVKYNYADIERSCETLLSRYNDMNQCVKRFSTVLDKHKEDMDDQIMRAAQTILQNIKDDMVCINQCIRKAAEHNKECARDIGSLENELAKEVWNIGK